MRKQRSIYTLHSFLVRIFGRSFNGQVGLHHQTTPNLPVLALQCFCSVCTVPPPIAATVCQCAAVQRA